MCGGSRGFAVLGVLCLGVAVCIAVWKCFVSSVVCVSMSCMFCMCLAGQMFESWVICSCSVFVNVGQLVSLMLYVFGRVVLCVDFVFLKLIVMGR